MSWLNSWLKDIVLIILLAVFVDLLIPNHAMERYVRLVVSLFILLALVYPVIHLLKADIDFNKFPLSLDQLKQANGETPAFTNPPKSLAAILQEAEGMKLADQKQSMQLLETQMSNTIKQAIQQVTTETVELVLVKTNMDESNNPQINSLTIVLASEVRAVNANNNSKLLKADKMLDFKPIEPVNIQVQLESTNKDIEVLPTTLNVLTEEQETAKQTIIKWIKQQYSLSSAVIRVVYKNESQQ